MNGRALGNNNSDLNLDQYMGGRIIFVHDGLAFYPSMLASKKFFASQGYVVEERRREEIGPDEDLSGDILWLMMGFYPTPVTKSCLAVIHEYRSQSLGRFRSIRDHLKRLLNHKPDYRLFQSERIRQTFERNDGVKSGLLPLGVSREILRYRCDSGGNFLYDFCYIGAISKERGIPYMLDGFLEKYGARRTFILVGDVRDGIDRQYCNYENVRFVGRLPQEEAFEYVNASEYAVCFFPSHAPHCYQPPTKLYEYAALGKKIIANRAPSNLSEISRLRIEARIIDGNHFPDDSDLSSIEDNMNFDPSSLFFENSIELSGVATFIEEKFGERYGG